MHAIRKSDLKTFHCKSEDVCRIENGSTNSYLLTDRAIEEFLPDVERNYNSSVTKLREGKPDVESVYAIAGFASYVVCCAPAAMRIHSGPLRSVLEATANVLDKQGGLPHAPEELSGKSLSELLADGTVRCSIDPKYPQALGINTIVSRLSVWGNSNWEILHNREDSSPFFTSDFPVGLELITPAQPHNWIIPLAPDLAIRIIPDVKLSGAEPDLTFSRFRFVERKLKRAEIVKINQLIIRCAEDLVFYRDNRGWISDFVAKNRAYRIEAINSRIPYATGILSVSTQRVVPYPRPIRLP